jgi:hypothetical protein
MSLFAEKAFGCPGWLLPSLRDIFVFAPFSMSSEVWQDLVLSILSVNSYSLEKTYSCVDSLRREGLFDPKKLAGWTQDEIARRLRRGGYNRGEYLNNLFASRLLSLGRFVEGAGVEESERILTKSDRSAIRSFLKAVNGVGPQVLTNFSVLRQPTQL